MAQPISFKLEWMPLRRVATLWVCLALLTHAARGADTEVDLPGDVQLQDLVQRTLLAFDAAIKRKDFTDFRQLTSSALSGQKSADDLRAAFHDFIDRHANLAGIGGATPVWDMPPSLRDGVLSVRGRYPTVPMQVLFTIKYVYEMSDWKVQGIDVKLKRPDTQPADATAATQPATAPAGPSPVTAGEANRLTRRTLLLFNDCVKAGDFTPLYDGASAAFRAQVSPRRLAGAFKQFTEKHIDLSSIQRLDPQEIDAPRVDDQHVLTVHGRYATNPTVMFQARYIQEDSSWKLLGLSVKTEETPTKNATP